MYIKAGFEVIKDDILQLMFKFIAIEIAFLLYTTECSPERIIFAGAINYNYYIYKLF